MQTATSSNSKDHSYYSGDEDHGIVTWNCRRIQPYHGRLELQRLQLYYTANEVAEGKRKAILLSGCGVATYRLIKNLAAPQKPTDLTFPELVNLVGEHYNPKPSVIMERFCFNTRIRQQGESVAIFIAELRHLTRYCDFGESLKDMLRDRLVCGIENGPIQCRLLPEPSLTLDKAIEISLAM